MVFGLGVVAARATPARADVGLIDPQNDLELELQGGIGFRLYF
jgi:hypothetical protein